MKYNITPLPHHFMQLSLYAPSHNHAMPGHYVIINHSHLCYIMGKNNDNIELITKNFFTEKIFNISELQGTPLPPPDKQTFNLFIFNNNEINTCLFYLKLYRTLFNGLVIIGSEDDFPFHPCPSRQLIPGMPSEVIAALPLLEDWGIPHRLASLKEQCGVYHGTAKELADKWVEMGPSCLKLGLPPSLRALSEANQHLES